MRRVVTVAPRRMEIQTAAREPVPGSDEALVGIEVVGLCGSDYHLFSGDHPYAQFPQTQGHELAGIVELLPAGYSGAIHVGDRVAIDPVVPCGACFACRRGHSNCCASLKVLGAHLPGGLADRLALRVESLHPVGDLPAELTALVEPVSIGLHAVRRGRIEASDKIVVLGAGPIGLAVTLAAVDAGAEVLIVDRLRSRLALGADFGAGISISNEESDLFESVLEWTQGEGPAVVVDATGAPTMIRSAVQLVAPSGSIVVVGISDADVAVPVIELTRKEVDIVGSRNSGGQFSDAVALVERSASKLRAMISHRFPLEQTGSAIQFALGNPADVYKVVIEVSGGTR